MLLCDIGEFGLIKELSKYLRGGRGVVKGIGDDTAVIRHAGDNHLLFTTDMLIEGVHFKIPGATPFLIGRKALAVNISDIAAMGGRPRYAVVAIGVPPHFSVSFARELYRGIKTLAAKFGISVVGGDTNGSDKLVVSVSLIGEAEKGSLVLRSGARAGDAIFVTGRLGGSLKTGAHLKFMPRVKEARFLVKHFKINSMIDISDGLASDLTRIIEASRVGAVIEKRSIPLNKGCKADSALFNGEDFELLFTVPRKRADALSKRWPYRLKLTRIGEITPTGRKIILLAGGRAERMARKGFDHFQ